MSGPSSSSAFNDAELIASAVSAGAAGYMARTASPGEIRTAIERVGRGGVADTAIPGPPAPRVRRASIADDAERF